jgi:hypothetical protein
MPRKDVVARFTYYCEAVTPGAETSLAGGDDDIAL